MTPDLMAAVVEHAQTDPLVAVDLLIEQRATLTEVLLAYAGNPPEWEDGLPQEALAEWLARQEPADGRAKTVEGYWVEQAIDGSSWWTVLDGYKDSIQNWRTNSAARRYLKRRVLSMFGEVAVARQVRMPREILESARTTEEKEWAINRAANTLRASGIEPSVKMRITRTADEIVYENDVSAPDWVPPHEEEWAREFSEDIRAGRMLAWPRQ